MEKEGVYREGRAYAEPRIPRCGFVVTISGFGIEPLSTPD